MMILSCYYLLKSGILCGAGKMKCVVSGCDREGKFRFYMDGKVDGYYCLEHAKQVAAMLLPHYIKLSIKTEQEITDIILMSEGRLLFEICDDYDLPLYTTIAVLKKLISEGRIKWDYGQPIVKIK